MEIVFTNEARKEFKKLDNSLKILFNKHLEKMKTMENVGRHLRLGVPFYVENVGSSSRIVYDIENGKIIITYFFVTHKDYENWYVSFR
jgi:mRNA-degrading endonuclease RelE of RelBE toxin-antitoxin system